MLKNKDKEYEADGTDSSCETFQNCFTRGREEYVNKKTRKSLEAKLNKDDMTTEEKSLDILSFLL